MSAIFVLEANRTGSNCICLKVGWSFHPTTASVLIAMLRMF